MRLFLGEHKADTREQYAAYTTPLAESTNRAMRVVRTLMIARAIAAMTDLRDLREGRVGIMDMDMIIITDMERGKGRRERGVRMRTRRCPKLRVVGLRRRAECRWQREGWSQYKREVYDCDMDYECMTWSIGTGRSLGELHGLAFL